MDDQNKEIIILVPCYKIVGPRELRDGETIIAEAVYTAWGSVKIKDTGYCAQCGTNRYEKRRYREITSIKYAHNVSKSSEVERLAKSRCVSHIAGGACYCHI